MFSTNKDDDDDDDDEKKKLMIRQMFHIRCEGTRAPEPGRFSSQKRRRNIATSKTVKATTTNKAAVLIVFDGDFGRRQQTVHIRLRAVLPRSQALQTVICTHRHSSACKQQ